MRRTSPDRDVKNEIAEEFIRQFNQKGVDLTLDEICQAIHISKKTIYRYYGGKDDIYDYILSQIAKEIAETQDRISADESIPLKERLYRALTIQSSWEAKIEISRLMELKDGEPAFYQKVLASYEVKWDNIFRLLDEGKATGLVRKDLDTAFLVTLLTRGMQAIFGSGVFSSMSYHEALEQMVKVVLNGVLVSA